MAFLLFVIFMQIHSSITGDKADEFHGVAMRRAPMMRLDITSDDHDHLREEMKDSSSIFSLEMSLEPFHKRWIQFAVVLLNGHTWRVTSSEISCPGKNGLCTDDHISSANRLQLQLTKTSDCPSVVDKMKKPFKLKSLKLAYTVRQQTQWRSVHFTLTDLELDDPCNVEGQPTIFEVNPQIMENIDCSSSQPLTRTDPFRGFYLKDSEYLNTTWCEHTCTCRNASLLCKPLECGLKYNPNTERSLWVAGECCQFVDRKNHFDENMCQSNETAWTPNEDPQRKMLVQLFRMPLWTVPYMVFHSRSYVAMCMASFIHKRWMITAANCLYHDGKLATQRQLIFGSTFFRLRVKRIHIHPEFRSSTPRSPVGDVAIFELETDQPFGSFQTQLNLPTDEQCGQFLDSDCGSVTSVYGNDVSEFLFGMSSTIGIKSPRFPLPRNVIARLVDVHRDKANPDDHLLKISFDEKNRFHRGGIPNEAGCVSADGSALVVRQKSAYFLLGIVTALEKGTLGSMNTGDSMCHETDSDVVLVCPYLDWIRLIMTLPNTAL